MDMDDGVEDETFTPLTALSLNVLRMTCIWCAGLIFFFA